MTERIEATTTATLTRRQELLDRGFSSNAIQRERSAGRLSAVRRGVYTPTGAFSELGLELRHAARARAVAIAAPGLVMSHISAAVLHQLPVRPSGLARVHATRISASGGIGDDRRVVHIGRLFPEDVVEIDGVRTTSLARTLVDLARTESFEAGVIAADSAFHSQPDVVDRIADVLARSRRHRGHAMARRALLFADGRSESVGETRLRVFLQDGGFAPPELQCEVLGGDGTMIGRVDLANLKFGTLLEFDGMAKYGKLLNPHRTELEVLRQEKKREEALREAGWQVFRVVWADLAATPLLHHRISDAFARGRRTLAANPVAGSVRLTPRSSCPADRAFATQRRHPAPRLATPHLGWPQRTSVGHKVPGGWARAGAASAPQVRRELRRCGVRRDWSRLQQYSWRRRRLRRSRRPSRLRGQGRHPALRLTTSHLDWPLHISPLTTSRCGVGSRGAAWAQEVWRGRQGCGVATTGGACAERVRRQPKRADCGLKPRHSTQTGP